MREYVAAGADMIYVDAIRSEDDILRVLEAAGDVPVNINMGFGIRTRPTAFIATLLDRMPQISLIKRQT